MAPESRRRFLRQGAIAAIALATAPVAAQVIHTDATGLVVGEARIPVPGGQIPAYFARPVHGGPFAAVLVVEEIFGVTNWLKDVCRRLAKAGYAVVAPDVYARIADLAALTDVRQIEQTVIARTADTTVLGDLDAAAAWAVTNGGAPGRIGVMGFGEGGRNAWLYAEHNSHLRAAVAWYGPVAGPRTPLRPYTPLDLAAALKCPLLGLYGGKDTHIDPADVTAAVDKAKAAGHTVEIAWFPDAPDGFAADDRPTYVAEDAANAWKRALEWFGDYGLA